MSFDYVTIDFETANHHRGSPCAVGLVRVRGGEVVDSQCWLMRPPPGHDHFEPYNVSVHGINSMKVKDQPTFQALLPRILVFIGDDLVCAHNARFDAAVLDAAATAVGRSLPRIEYLCTLTAARRCLKLPSYRLPFVAQVLGVPLVNHHEAGADAYATAQIVPGLAAAMHATDLGEMRIATQRPAPSKPLPTVSAPDPDASPDHHLYGRVMVFTGALSTMTRAMAHTQVIRVGAMPEKTVTARTNVLVIGELDPARLVPGDVLSQKAQKAFRLREHGQDIEVMTEYEFLQSL